jgi:hypothetical protein
MKSDKLVLVATICDHYSLELPFFDQLDHHGMVEIVQVGQDPYIKENQLSILEKVIRIHHDLQVNLDGVAVILDLVDRIELLQQENRNLRRQIRVY